MLRLINKCAGLIIVFSLLLLSTPLHGQDSITAGIYNFLGDRHYELIFQVNGQFKFTHIYLSRGRTFHGTWTRVNDSTIKAHSDTVVTTGLERHHLLNEFYCIQSKDTNDVWCHFRYIDIEKKDTGKFQLLLHKEASFHATGELREEIKQTISSTIVTTYYPNGRIKEVMEYKKHLKNGLHLEYGPDGRLIIYQFWRKGKLKMEEKWEPFNKGVK